MSLIQKRPTRGKEDQKRRNKKLFKDGHGIITDNLRVLYENHVKGRIPRHLYRVITLKYGEGKLLLFKYRVLRAIDFLRYPVLLTMRGHVVYIDHNGEFISGISNPFTKFFNWHEWQEILPRELSRRISGGYTIYEKLDGTLIICSRLPCNDIICHTRGWFEKGNVFVRAFSKYVENRGLSREVERLLESFKTLVFEIFVPGMSAVDKGYDIAILRHGVVALLAGRKQNGELIDAGKIDTIFNKPRMIEEGDIGETAKKWGGEGVVIYPADRIYSISNNTCIGSITVDFLVKYKNIDYVFGRMVTNSDGTIHHGRLFYIIAWNKYEELLPKYRNIIGKYVRLEAKLRKLFIELTKKYRDNTERNKRILCSNNMCWITRYVETINTEATYLALIKDTIFKKTTEEAVISGINRLIKKLEKAYNLLS